jgi:hypothetical protein
MQRLRQATVSKIFTPREVFFAHFADVLGELCGKICVLFALRKIYATHPIKMPIPAKSLSLRVSD